MARTAGVIGSGAVGKVLAEGLRAHGWDVRIGSRTPAKLRPWGDAAGISVGDFAETAAYGEVVVLAVQGGSAVEAVDLAGAANLAGKVVIDATNPIAAAPPDHGILRFFTGPNDSLMERLQARVPDARFVKAFSSVGNALMVNPKLPARPAMFICGNDSAAKAVVVGILDSFGWDAEDVGGVEGARAIEPLCQLWCAPGFLRNDWMHAFAVLRPA